MLSIQLTEPKRLEKIDVPELTAPGKGEVLVRVEHVGVCGTDIHAYHGRQPFFTYPRILGHELGVVVESVGSGVSGVMPGDRCAVEPYLATPGDRAFSRGKTNCSSTTQCLGVHLDGGMRERMIVPENKLHASEKLDTKALALVEMLSIGCHAVERARLLKDETVAVVGLGPIGLATLQFVRSEGVEAIGVEVSDDRLTACSEIFPDVRLLKGDVDTPVSEVWKKEIGVSPDVVFDCTGNARSMEQSIELPDFGGRIVLVGLCLDSISFNDPSFHKRELSILSSRNATAKNFKEVIRQLEQDLIAPEKWIRHECAASEFPRKIEEWIQPAAGLIKGMIRF